jgi:hypothetical protein
MKRYHYEDEEDDEDENEDFPDFPHSGLGVASFLITLAMGIFVFVLVLLAGILESKSENGIDEDSPVAFVLGLAIMGGLMVNLLGMGLGIGGLCQHDRKKLFAGLGLGFGTVVLLGIGVLFIIGLAMG